LSDLKLVDGAYQILLDINEEGNNPGEYLKLSQFEVHLSADGMVNDYDPDNSRFSDGLYDGANYEGLVFDMDEWKTTANSGDPADIPTTGFTASGLILKNCSGNAPATGGNCGSGNENYVFSLPVELFETAVAAGGEYLHVVATMGEGDINPQDGSWNPVAIASQSFDEFAVLSCLNPKFNDKKPESDKNVKYDTGAGCGGGEVPIPGTTFLLGLGLSLIGFGRRRRAVI
jgi:hypothetical protein